MFLAYDVEADGFRPKEIFCICTSNLITGENLSYYGDEIADACVILTEADMVVGHYIRGYDCPVIEKLTGGLVKFRPEAIVDTLDMSKALMSQPKHSLKEWGSIIGLPKLESPLFESFTPEMLTYCERDVEITVRIFFQLLETYVAAGGKKKFRNCEALDRFFAAL